MMVIGLMFRRLNYLLTVTPKYGQLELGGCQNDQLIVRRTAPHPSLIINLSRVHKINLSTKMKSLLKIKNRGASNFTTLIRFGPLTALSC